MNLPLWIALPTAALVALAAWTDIRTRRIPNRLTGPAVGIAIAAHAIVNGKSGLEGAFLGMLIAGGLLLPGWFAGWMGAGDVKLMAAIGAWLGAPQAIVALLATLLAGGLIALSLALRRGVLMQSLRNAAWMGAWLAGGTRLAMPEPATSGIRFPFAVAAVAGVVVALVFAP